MFDWFFIHFLIEFSFGFWSIIPSIFVNILVDWEKLFGPSRPLLFKIILISEQMFAIFVLLQSFLCIYNCFWSLFRKGQFLGREAEGPPLPHGPEDKVLRVLWQLSIDQCGQIEVSNLGENPCEAMPQNFCCQQNRDFCRVTLRPLIGIFALTLLLSMLSTFALL